MKIAKFFAWLFGILASALMVFSIGLCLVSLNAGPDMQEVPAGAAECAEELLEAITSGNFTAAAQRLYGQPDLGVDREPGETEGVMIYEAFLDSLSYEWKGAYYATGTGVARDAVLTYLDIPSVTEQLDRRVQMLATARVEDAEDVTRLYDENHQLREELVAEVLSEAVVRGLAEDAELVKQELTLNLVCRDGRWQAVLDEALLQVLTGGLA